MGEASPYDSAGLSQQPEYPQQSGSASSTTRPDFLAVHRASEDSTLSTRPLPSTRGSEDALLADAGRIFEQLRIRLAELDHQEQSLSQQQQQLNERQTRYSRWVEQTKQDLANREIKLVEAEKQAELHRQELAEKSAQIDQTRQQLEREEAEATARHTIREARARELELEMETLRKNRLEEIRRREQEADDRIAEREQEFEQNCQLQLEEIRQQQAQATRRLRLQEDHLERLRQQIEQQKNELQKWNQKARQEQQQQAEKFRLRHQQLNQVRERLDLIEQNRAYLFAQEQQRFQAEQEQLAARQQDWELQVQDWKQQQDYQQRDLDWLSSQLERREKIATLEREKLTVLKGEIQRQHAENLEIRLAIEELKIEQAVEHGQTPDLDSLNAVRDRLASHFVSTREQLENLQQQLAEQAQLVQQQTAEQHVHEQTTRDWISQAMSALKDQNALITRQRETLEQTRKRWEADQSRIFAERHEAERIIQSLLSQLESADKGDPVISVKAA